MSDEALRQPPRNLEAEAGVLGSMLLDAGAIDRVAEVLDPDDFFRDAHQVAYRTLLALRDARTPVEALTLNDELLRLGLLERVGGVAFAQGLVEQTASPANALHYASIVREKSIVRQLIDAASGVIADAYSDRFTARELADAAESRVFAVSARHASVSSRPLGHFAGQAVERFGRRRGGEQAGVPFGFPDLDMLCDGMADGQLVILAARPSMGKTAFALQVCDSAALGLGVPVLFVSLEMNGVELAERLLVLRSGVDGGKVRGGHNLSDRDLQALGRALREAEGARGFFIDDHPTRTASQVAAIGRRHRSQHGIGLVVVDYLQLLDAAPEQSRASRQEQVSTISRRLKAVAKELGVPVLCLSQLNRQSEQREDRRPRLSDLRESGAIEQDADLVLLLHRPSFFDPNDRPGEADVIVAKNRNGPTGTVRLVFQSHLMRFAGLSPLPETRPDGPAY